MVETIYPIRKNEFNYDFCKDTPFRVWYSRVSNNWSINNDEEKITLGWHGCNLDLDKSSHPTELSALNYLKDVVLPKYYKQKEEK